MKLDAQQSVPRTPLRFMYLDNATIKTVQLAPGWYKLSVSNYYGYNSIVCIQPSDASTPNVNPFATPAVDYSTQGRTASNTEALKFYVDDSACQWTLRYYGQAQVIVFLERIPAPSTGEVSL